VRIQSLIQERSTIVSTQDLKWIQDRIFRRAVVSAVQLVPVNYFTTRARNAIGYQTSRPILDEQVNQLFIDRSVYQAGLLRLALYLQTVQLR
jgi:hypothetical protein